jgi:hypothetical protein
VFELLLAKIAAGLRRLYVDYMVIGGQAVLVHGRLRSTQDIDITLSIDSDQLPAILTLIKKLKIKPLVDNPEDFVKRTKVLPVVEVSSGIHVNFIFLSSEYERTAISRAISKRYGRASVKFATAEDLTIHKIIAGRPRDIEDIKSVLIKNQNFDKSYVEPWLRKFDKALDTSYLKSFRAVLKQLR